MTAAGRAGTPGTADAQAELAWSLVVNQNRDKGVCKYLGATAHPYAFEEFGTRILIAAPTLETFRAELNKRYNRTWANGDTS